MSGEDDRTLGQKVADLVADVVGSWPFIIVQTCLLIVWLYLNYTEVTGLHHWDPYPFILLNLMLSFQAAYTGPIVMISSNRSSEIDRAISQETLDVLNELDDKWDLKFPPRR